MTKVAEIYVHPVNITGMPVNFEVEDTDLRNPEQLGRRLTEAILQMLATNVQRKSNGLLVPCRFCATQMVIRQRGADEVSRHERGLCCPDEGCPGSKEFWAVP